MVYDWTCWSDRKELYVYQIHMIYIYTVHMIRITYKYHKIHIINHIMNDMNRVTLINSYGRDNSNQSYVVSWLIWLIWIIWFIYVDPRVGFPRDLGLKGPTWIPGIPLMASTKCCTIVLTWGRDEILLATNAARAGERAVRSPRPPLWHLSWLATMKCQVCPHPGMLRWLLANPCRIFLANWTHICIYIYIYTHIVNLLHIYIYL